MTAIEAAFSHLIDYAGLYPPAALGMQTAVRNYLDYAAEKHARMLGRFIVDVGRLDELREAAGEQLGAMRLSVVAAADTDLRIIETARDGGFRIEAVEVKCDEPLSMARTCERLSSDLECYFEIPIAQVCTASVDVLAGAGARAKLRMGGVTAEVFPASQQIAKRMHLLNDRGVAFKATAGLHHPVRSEHKLTYAADSPSATMHGFMNVLCAAAAIRFGDSAETAVRILEEQNPAAFHVSDEAVGVYEVHWTAEQMGQVREFFTGFGSCSFTEPIEDLEALGWLPKTM